MLCKHIEKQSKIAIGNQYRYRKAAARKPLKEKKWNENEKERQRFAEMQRQRDRRRVCGWINAMLSILGQLLAQLECSKRLFSNFKTFFQNREIWLIDNFHHFAAFTKFPLILHSFQESNITYYESCFNSLHIKLWKFPILLVNKMIYAQYR